ncbi:MAG: hypothetical protein U9R19_06620 [Bacteroidota bacterium]|nr:hypothetical protein [Bacteroidota bacterium]
MKNLNIILLFIVFAQSVFSQQIDTLDAGYSQFYYPDGTLASEGIISDNKPNGYWKTYYAKGQLKSEGNRRFFNLEGVWVFYNQQGDTIEKINYRSGRKNGYYYTYNWKYNKKKRTGGLVSKELYVKDKLQNKSYYYFPDGNIYRIINYKNNKKQGIAFEYNREGKIIFEIEFRQGVLTKRLNINKIDKNNLKQGLWREYYLNDRIKTEANYVDDKLNGQYKEYDIRGQLKINKRFNMNVEIEQKVFDEEKIIEKVQHHSNGKISSKGGFIKNIPVGVHRNYNEKGKVISTSVFDDEGNIVGEGIIEESGKKKGNWRSFYPGGELKSEGTYKKGRRQGNWVYYFENGVIEQTGSFKNNKLLGKWIWYYDTGEIWREELFFNGHEDGEYIEYSRKGEIIAKGEYVDGLREGKWFDRYGDQIEKGIYSQGEKEGLWEFFYLNENLKFEGKFIQGKEDGRHKWFYQNGKPKEDRYYVYGSREKLWKYFNPDGTLFMTVTYRNNKEIKINGRKIDDVKHNNK